MSIERLMVCACGHSVNLHDASGCDTLLKRGPDHATCPCPLTRSEALDRLIDAEVVRVQDMWKRPERRKLVVSSDE